GQAMPWGYKIYLVCILCQYLTKKKFSSKMKKTNKGKIVYPINANGVEPVVRNRRFLQEKS
ncbi:MAG: hypothetical protein LBJ90_05530, partial [Treponema sp.]|nr:hypothetical protein [Treponema sp.]